jgi:hypothetical protein
MKGREEKNLGKERKVEQERARYLDRMKEGER